MGADLRIVIAEDVGVMTEVAACIDRNPGFGVFAGLAEIAHVIMAGPAAMMRLQQEFRVLPLGGLDQKRVAAAFHGVEIARNPPPAPIDREMRWLLRHLGAG